MDLGPHAVFIVAAYAFTAAVVAGLILWAVLDGRAQRRALAELEARGVRPPSTNAGAPRPNRESGGRAAGETPGSARAG